MAAALQTQLQQLTAWERAWVNAAKEARSG
jgi:hypothetical protein